MAIIKPRSALLTDVSQFNALTPRGSRSYTQLDRGSFRSELSSIVIDDISVISCALNRGLVGSISSKPGTLYIGYSLGGEEGTRFNGVNIDCSSVIIHWGDKPKLWQTHAGFHIGAVELPLHKIADDEFLATSFEKMKDGGALLLDGFEIKRELLLYVQASDAVAYGQAHTACAQQFSNALVAHCRSVVERGFRMMESGNVRAATSRPLSVFAKANAVIHESGGAILNIPQLSRSLGISDRTLLHCFRAAVGRTPQEFLRAYRLNRAREHLLNHVACTGNAVTEAAMTWGFWHLGRFSAYYRAMFGEYPFETASSVRAK